MENPKINLKYLFSTYLLIWLIYHFTYGYLRYYFHPEELTEILEFRLFQLFIPGSFGNLIVILLFWLNIKFSKNTIHRVAGFIISIPLSIILYMYTSDICFYFYLGELEVSGIPHIIKSLTYHIYMFTLLNSLGYIFIFWKKYKNQNLENRELLENLSKKEEDEKYSDSKIFLSSRHVPNHIDLSSIKYIHADAYLSHIVTNKNKRITLERSLKKWEDKLPEKMFYRIHRSTIVNTDFISKIERQSNQTYSVFLKECEEPLSMSRRYGKDFISNPQFCHLF